MSGPVETASPNRRRGCRSRRPLIQQGVYEDCVRRAAHLTSYPPRPAQHPKFGVDGLDVAHPRSVRPSVVHASLT